MRLFVAVDLGARVRREVESLLPRLRRLAADARWVNPEQLHLTLVFLGNVPADRLPAVTSAVEVAARGRPPFSLHVKGGGTFGGKARPRVLWAAIEAPPLASLQAEVDRRLRAEGFALEDRAFTPHLTLARARDPRGDPGLRRAAEVLQATDLGDAHVDRVEVMESHLSPKGSRYEVRAAPALG